MNPFNRSRGDRAKKVFQLSARPSKAFQSKAFQSKVWQLGVSAVAITTLSVVAAPALAHHAMGGRMPTNFWEGFLSGIAHPLIGPDHFAFIVSVGLLAATCKRGLLIPMAFVLAAMVGAGLHLATLSIPGVELFVAGSIVLFGILLASKDRLHPGAIAGFSALAGVFHGYAYGESIFGAETTPLLSYLAGFTVIQFAVALVAFVIGRATIPKATVAEQDSRDPSQPIGQFRSAGWVICGVGLAFFASHVVSLLLPLSHA